MKRKNTIMRKSINEKYILLLSHLTRGAWIEMDINTLDAASFADCRTSHEVRGLKFKKFIIIFFYSGRTSHEVRGLKCELFFQILQCLAVAPHTRCVD